MKRIESKYDVKIGDFVLYKGDGIEMGRVTEKTDYDMIHFEYIRNNVWKQFSGNGIGIGNKDFYLLTEEEALAWSI